MYDCGFTKEKEEMCWIPIKDLDKYKAFPSFLQDYLSKEHTGIEHIVTDDRVKVSKNTDI